MAKRNVFTIKVSIDTKKPNHYITNMVGNKDFPANELSGLLSKLASEFGKLGRNTVGDYMESNK